MMRRFYHKTRRARIEGVSFIPVQVPILRPEKRLVAVQGLACLSLGGFAIGLCGTARG